MATKDILQEQVNMWLQGSKSKLMLLVHEDSTVTICTKEQSNWYMTSETGIVKINVRTGEIDIGI